MCIRDRLKAYPMANATGIADDNLVRAIELLDGTDPVFGTEVTYSVACVDAIGRISNSVSAAPVQLQKLSRPPMPVAPVAHESTQNTPGDAVLYPSGIQVRLLQTEDPELTTEERRKVNTEGDCVVLKWGWSKELRDLDAHVTEFRIYRYDCLLYTSPSPRDRQKSRMPSSA